MFWNRPVCFAGFLVAIVFAHSCVCNVNAFTSSLSSHVPLRTIKTSNEVIASLIQVQRRIYHVDSTLLNAKKNDDNDDDKKKKQKKSTTILDGKPPNEKRYYTYEELESNPELYEMERRQSQRIESLWVTIPSLISQAVTAAAWIFIASTLVLQSQGYGWIIDHSTNRIYIDTLEQRDFINTLYTNSK